MNAETLAKCLGAASVAIGLTEIAGTKKLEQWMGINNGENSGVLRSLGVREIAHGVDILSHDDPTSGVWGRVAGDALDTALLAGAARKTKNPAGLAIISAMVMAIGAMDLMCALKLSKNKKSWFS